MRSRLTRTISVLALSTCALALAQSPALAQKGGKKPPAAAEPPAPEDPKLAEAKQHMGAGAAFYNDPSGHKCEEAYREFKKAFELSGSPNAVKGMGLCAMELERDGEAISLLEKFLEARGDQIDPGDREQMETDLKAIKSAVVWVTLRTDKPGTVVTDTRTPSRGFPITNRYPISVTGTKLGIHPGVHEFKANVDDRPEQTWKAELSNGGTVEHSFEFEKGKPVTADGFTTDDLKPQDDKPPAKLARPVPTSVYVLGGASVLVGIGGVVVGGALATNARAEYDQSNGNDSAPVLEHKRSQVVTLNTVADVCFGVAAVGAVTTLVLFLTRPEKKVAEPPKDSIAFAPWATPRSGGAMLVGSF